MDKVRQAALEIITEVYEKDAYANVALVKKIRQHKLSGIDRAFCTSLVYGTVKAGETLDWIIRRYTKRPLSKIDPVVKNILRLGIYQLFYMDKVPASAACNEMVEIAKQKAGLGASKFVNGLLRSAVREPEKAKFPAGQGKATENLALSACHPQWLIKRWIKSFGFENAKKLAEFDNEDAPLTLRTNTLKISRAELVKKLAETNMEVQLSKLTPEGIIVNNHSELDNFSPIAEGLCQVQDESSMLVAHVLAPEPGEFIIDCCSAPGGKTTHIAALMENRGRIVAGDIYEHKIERIRENAERLGISIIEAELIDAREIGKKYENQADRVLVDAPCSGLGVLRRKADARWRKKTADLTELPKLQREILSEVSRAVKKGGVLVYSTCTIEAAENYLMVEDFLREHGDFYLEKTGSYLPMKNAHSDDDMVQLLPHVDGTDGFFIARMRRKN